MMPAPTRHVLPSDDAWLGYFRRPAVKALLEDALTRAETWARRDRRLGSLAGVVFVLLMVLHRDLSMPNILKKMVSAIRLLDPDQPLQLVTNEALLKRRKHLAAKTLKHLFEATAAAAVAAPTGFLGREAYVIDGTWVTVPDSPANSDYFGRCKATRGRSAFPQMMMVVLMEVTTRRIVGAVLQRCDLPEARPAWDLVRNLKPGSVLFVDRGFASAAFMEHCMILGLQVVMRMKARSKPTALASLGKGDNLVQLTSRAPKWERRWKARPVVVRFITFRIEDEVIRLATTFVDPNKVSAIVLARSYVLRWEVELGIKEVKGTLIKMRRGVAQTHLRSLLPELVEQEAYAFLALYNMLRELVLESAGRAEVNPHFISFTDTVEHLRSGWPEFSVVAQVGLSDLVSRLVADVGTFVNPRPRRPRACDRMVKQRTGRIPVKTEAYRERKVPRERPLIFVKVSELRAA